MLLESYLDDSPKVTRASIEAESPFLYSLWGAEGASPDTLLAEATTVRDLVELAKKLGVKEIRYAV